MKYTLFSNFTNQQLVSKYIYNPLNIEVGK